MKTLQIPQLIKRVISRKKTFLVLLLVAVGSTGCAGTITSQETSEATRKEKQELARQVDVPVVLAARFKIKPEKREMFIELATATLQPTRAEEGVISYSFYEESTVPNSFIYFEEWQSREALAKHLKTPYTQRLLDNFSDMLDGEANIRVYDIKSLTYGLEAELSQ